MVLGRFQQVNRGLTMMWGFVFSAMVVSSLLAGAARGRVIDTRRADTIFNWVIPIILIVWAVKRTSEVRRAEGVKDD